jgi:hypothetical protein
MESRKLPLKQIRIPSGFGPPLSPDLHNHIGEPCSAAFVSLLRHIKARGILTPIHIDRNCNLVEGYYRLLAARHLQMQEVPVRVVDRNAFQPAMSGGAGGARS